MINKNLTGITLLNYDPSMDFFYHINDTFIAGERISFCCPLNTLNSLLGISINSGNISAYNLYVRIVNSIDGVNINNILFDKNYTLTSSNILNNSFYVDITEITDKISHDYLCDTMTDNEIFSLFKSFKIIFRIYTGELSNNNIVDTNDIVQDLNICLNTAETGPYNVKLKEIDLLNTNIFSKDEAYNIYSSKPFLCGRERIRVFYPENIKINNLSPIILFSHGNGQYSSGYDLYLSDLASYGYVCISVTANPDNNESESILFLQILEHLKENKLILESKIFSDIVNFNKINYGGHSRGGALAIIAALRLRNKQYFPSIASSSFSIADIKSLILFADAANGACLYENIYSIVDTAYIGFGGELSVITESDLKYFDMFINLPIFNLQGTKDGDSSFSDVVYGYGFCYDIKRNYTEILNIVPNDLLHGELQSFSKFSRYDYNSHSNIWLTGNPRWAFDESRLVHNTNLPKLNDCKSELIYFLSRHNFNSKKIKKLNYLDSNLLSKKIQKNNKKLIHKNIKEHYNELKYIIDNFNGITLSYAGITGLTFTAIGHTYDYAVDKEMANSVLNIRSRTSSEFIAFQNAVYENRIKLEGPLIPNDEDFCGIVGFNYRGLYVPISSNFIMGYTFNLNLTLAENNYFVLNGALKVCNPVSSGNTMDANFYMTLIDSNLNGASLSSKISSFGFKAPYNSYKPNTIDYDANEFISQDVYHCNVYFRAGDFYLKNPNIALTMINQIVLSFGPDYGSTLAKLCFDEFIVLNEV